MLPRKPKGPLVSAALAQPGVTDSGNLIGRKLSETIRSSVYDPFFVLTTPLTRFGIFLPLHSLWMGYMSELLLLPPAPTASITQPVAEAVPNAAAMHAKLVKADFHGSLVTGASDIAYRGLNSHDV